MYLLLCLLRGGYISFLFVVLCLAGCATCVCRVWGWCGPLFGYLTFVPLQVCVCVGILLVCGRARAITIIVCVYYCWVYAFHP